MTENMPRAVIGPKPAELDLNALDKVFAGFELTGKDGASAAATGSSVLTWDKTQEIRAGK